MTAIRILAFVMILTGAFGLAYGHFSYTKETQDAKIGPIELSVKQKETIPIPQWVAAAAISAGVVLLLFDRNEA